MQQRRFLLYHIRLKQYKRESLFFNKMAYIPGRKKFFGISCNNEILYSGREIKSSIEYRLMMDIKTQLLKYRLKFSDYKKLKEMFGSFVPEAAFALASALWNEHCSYKSSKIHLKKFQFKTGKKVSAQGENAGIVDLGQGEKVAFKMESHNHPSHIIPYHGAATGVGGILRDVFAMNARPVLLANYLCFGLPKETSFTARLEGVVRGIGGYGNCIGIPNITGQTEFSDSYKGNTLVNAMALGLLQKRQMDSKARGVGNYVVYAGAPTGRDGILGASMASESFLKEKEGPKPTVQIGDPFFGKQLMEATLEAMEEGLVESSQDMGAAGLSSSSFEMAAKGGLGLSLHLDKVPLRDSSLKIEDILLSESQERMLFICSPEKWLNLKALFESYDLELVPLGEVLKEKEIKLYWKGKCFLKIDPLLFMEKATPLAWPYTLPEPAPRILPEDIPSPFKDIKKGLLEILSSPQGRSREFIYEQYDQRVGVRTVKDSRFPIGVLKLPESGRLLALSLGSRSHIMETDVEQGALDSVFYPALQLSLRGFTPWAVTDCLNFGSPEKPNIMGQFVLSVESIAAACKALDIPVVSGNVSFYNESGDEAVTPTPAIAMIGLQEKEAPLPESGFTSEGERVYLISSRQFYFMTPFLSDTKVRERTAYGALQPELINLFLENLKYLSLENCFNSARLVGKLGLLYTVARMVLEKGVGFSFRENFPTKEFFGEWLYQVIVSVSRDQEKAFLKAASQRGLEPYPIGETKGQELKAGKNQWSFKELKRHYNTSFFPDGAC